MGDLLLTADKRGSFSEVDTKKWSYELYPNTESNKEKESTYHINLVTERYT